MLRKMICNTNFSCTFSESKFVSLNCKDLISAQTKANCYQCQNACSSIPSGMLTWHKLSKLLLQNVSCNICFILDGWPSRHDTCWGREKVTICHFTVPVTQPQPQALRGGGEGERREGTEGLTKTYWLDHVQHPSNRQPVGSVGGAPDYCVRETGVRFPVGPTLMVLK